MSALVIYYSRTGTSRAIAEAAAEKLGCKTNEVVYPGRVTVPAFTAARHSVLRQRVAFEAEITGTELAKYDRLIFVFPVWAAAPAAPIRSFLIENRAYIARYDLIAAAKSSGLNGCIMAAAAILGRAPANCALIRGANVKGGKLSLPDWIA